jgi:hypothetical protein
LQEFATATEQLAHCAYTAIPKDHIKREASKSFADEAEDLVIKIQLLQGQKSVNEALRQALKMQTMHASCQNSQKRMPI